jgi:hypothetical protein
MPRRTRLRGADTKLVPKASPVEGYSCLKNAVGIYFMRKDKYNLATLNSGSGKKYYSVFCGIVIAITFVFSLSYAADNGASIIYEQELLNYINQYRIKKGLTTLSSDITLSKAAKNHSQYMNKNNALNHSDFNERFRQSKRSLCVENVGWNYTTPESQFKAWENSQDHNKNMLNKRTRHAGISKVGSYVTFFACD